MNRNPGEGLRMVIQYLKFLKNRISNKLFAPSCPTHGRQRIYAQRIHGEVRAECLVKDCGWMSEDWRARRESYLSDNWK